MGSVTAIDRDRDAILAGGKTPAEHPQLIDQVFPIFRAYLPEEELTGIEVLRAKKIYKLTGPNGIWIVKLFPAETSSEYIFKELWLTERAANLKIGPRVLHADLPKRGYILEYLEGIALDVKDEEGVKNALSALREVHLKMFPTVSTRIQVSYKKIIDNGIAVPPQLHAAVQEGMALERALEKSVCHGDAHHENVILGEDHAYLIDWELACLTHPYFDLIKMDPHHHQPNLLALYLEREPREEEKQAYSDCERLFYLARALYYLSNSGEVLTQEEEVCWASQMEGWMSEASLHPHLSYPFAIGNKPLLREGGCAALIKFFGEKR